MIANARGSLRWRLVAAMFFVFILGLGGALGLHPFEEHGAFLSRYFSRVVREPYQDLSVLLAFTLLSTGLIWIVSGWSLRGLATASREAAKIGPSAPDARLSTLRLPAEIRPLVEAVNGALDRLADAYGAERRFVADAAHQLRTPLAVLKLRIQRERDSQNPSWTKLEMDLAAVVKVVDQLLGLAQKDEETRYASTGAGEANIGRTAREAVAAMFPMAEAMGRTIEFEAPDRLLVHGRQDDLRELICNLVENALIHGEGVIRVAVSAGPSASSNSSGPVVLTVSDEGPGLSEDHKIVAFERFWKRTPNSPGSGLGLAIARKIAESCGGTLEFVEGERSAIRLSVPKIEAGSTDRR